MYCHYLYKYYNNFYKSCLFYLYIRIMAYVFTYWLFIFHLDLLCFFFLICMISMTIFLILYIFWYIFISYSRPFGLSRYYFLSLKVTWKNCSFSYKAATCTFSYVFVCFLLITNVIAEILFIKIMSMRSIHSIARQKLRLKYSKII